MKKETGLAIVKKSEGESNNNLSGLSSIKLPSIDISDQIKEFVELLLDPRYDVTGNDPNHLIEDAKKYGVYLLLLKNLRKEGKKYLFTLNKSSEFTNKEVKYQVNAFLKTETFSVFEKYLYKDIQIIEPLKRNNVKISGHYAEMILRTPDQLDLINPHIFNGRDLTQQEMKLMECLSILLHEKSQTSDPDADDYYTGNQPETNSLVRFGIDPSGTPSLRKPPMLGLKFFELTKRYYNNPKPSGKHIEELKNIVNKLVTKKFNISYIETYELKNGVKRLITVKEDATHLITKQTITQEDSDKDNNPISSLYDIIIRLNPIFNAQIGTKFLLVPVDIAERTEEANGGTNVPKSSTLLRTYLISRLSRRNPELNHQINVTKLLDKVASNYMEAGRKGEANKLLVRAISMCKKMGIILDHEIEKDGNGEDKIVFKLNKDWKD